MMRPLAPAAPSRRHCAIVFGGLVLVLASGLLSASASAAEADRAAERRQMVAAIEEMAASIGAGIGPGGFSPRVMEALATVPRHEFVPPEVSHLAYANRPLPIGSGQTISQPYIVALMTELMQVKPTDRVLEIGTGSGYQAAVLSVLAREVYTIEILPELGLRAAETLARLGYKNVVTRIGDGYQGWEERAPFDAIIVTAAPTHVPPALVSQLKPGGRLVIPVGDVLQHLIVVTKAPDGTTTTTSRVIPVRFVPLTRSEKANSEGTK
ncbi:MAG TPA: protein-L-isoaspartate(D-aspartate) O-methyltransferase [Hyphomicrobiaceae bacterium]|nr:protein-L-isoaspartate(D-aspartate) O-methyltransferase [Hyphomicrobiaceae bacterium]